MGAFNLSTAGWIPCGLLLGGTAFTLQRDEAAMQKRLHRVLSTYVASASSLGRLEDRWLAEHPEEAAALTLEEEEEDADGQEQQQRQSQQQQQLSSSLQWAEDKAPP